MNFHEFVNTQGRTEIMEIIFLRSPEMLKRSRKIYGPLDFIGDIGGLVDGVFSLGFALVAVIQAIFGNPLMSYLVTNIFEKDNS